MTNPIPVHGMTPPPAGCECYLLSAQKGDRYFDRDRHEWRVWEHELPSPYNEIVARPKWSVENLKPGDAVVLASGNRAVYAADASKFGDTSAECIVVVIDGTLGQWVSKSDIVGPWIEPDAEPQQPAIDPGEGHRLLRRGENPETVEKGDEFYQITQKMWVKCASPFGRQQHSTDIYRRKLPAWTPPEWAKGLGWMTQDDPDRKSDRVRFRASVPMFNGHHWSGGSLIGVMDVHLAKALNLYPPNWSDLPASERCVNLGGGT